MTFFKFKVRYIFQNIKHSIGSQIVILLSLSLLMVLLISSTNMYQGLKQVFYYESQEKYLDTDIVITYDVNSSSRVINRRSIETEFPTNFKSVSVFMNYFTTGKANGEFFYFEIITSTVYEMEKVAQIDISALSDRDIVITKSLSTKYNLSIGDNLQIAVNGNLQDYHINQIVIDNGIFQGDKVFFLKETLFNDLYGLSNLDNIGNMIYIDVKDDQDIDELILKIKNLEEFKEYHIFSTIDDYEINRKAVYNSSIFAGVGLLMIFAIYMVFHSLFPLIFKEYKPQLGVISSLGGKDKFLKQIWNIQIILLLILSFVIGTIGSYFVINQGAIFYGVNSQISLNFISVIMGFLGISVLVIIEVMIYYRKINNQSVIVLSTDLRFQKIKRNYGLVVLEGLILLGMLIFKPFTLGVNAIITIIISIVFFMSLIDMVFSFLSARKNLTLFGLYTLKHLKENKTNHNSMKVLFIAFEVIVATLTISVFIKSETTQLEKQIELDYAIMNIFNYNESMLDDILLDNRVKSSDDAIIYQETVVSFQTDSINNLKNFHFFVSMDYDQFDQYFHFKLNHEIDQTYLHYDIPYIVFPINMSTIYGVSIGDTVSLNISNEIGDIQFVVGGFFNTNYDHIVYSNLHEFEEYNDVAVSNTILIQSDGSDLFEYLSEEYSSKMYYVLDFSMLVSALSQTITSINDLFAFLCFIVLICFIVVILNNTNILFHMNKSDLGKLKTLGLNTHQMRILMFQEGFIVFLVVIIISYIESLILTPAIPNLMILFGYYKSIQVGFNVVLFGILIVFVIYFLSYLIYYFKWLKMNEIEEIKIF